MCHTRVFELTKSSVGLPGSHNGWNTTGCFYKTDETNVVKFSVSLSAGTYEFKIYSGSWLGNNRTINDSANGWVFSSSGGNCKLVATGGVYTFIFNTSTKKLTVEHTA